MNREKGLTFIELLVAMAIFTIIASVSISYFMSSNKLMEKDTNRVMTGQNGQAALDLMVADIRQAGENLNNGDVVKEVQISGVEFSNTPSTEHGENIKKEIIIRKGLPSSLRLNHPKTGQEKTFDIKGRPICDVSGGKIYILGDRNGLSTKTGCEFKVDPDRNGIDSKVEKYRDFFEYMGGKSQAALIYNEDSNGVSDIQRIRISRVSNVNKSVFNANENIDEEHIASLISPDQISGKFSYSNKSKIIFIDENRYALIGNDLIWSDGLYTREKNQVVAYDVQDIDISAEIKNSSGTYEKKTSLGTSSDWRNIRKINIEVTTGSGDLKKGKSRVFKGEVFIRNAIGGNKGK